MLPGLLARTFRLAPCRTTLPPPRVALASSRSLHQLHAGKTPLASLSWRARPTTSPQVRLYAFFSKPAPGAAPKPALDARFFSSNGALPAADLPVLSPPAVGNWLLTSAALVLAVIVVGGVTRLTESGLSITEWRPITGVLPPLSQADWEAEFDKYKATPEFRLLNSRMALDDFKQIYHMEWGHRLLGRTIGLAFVLPLAYFAVRRRLARALRLPLLGMAGLLGAQGALGWYMVQSGLDDAAFAASDAVPRVSQYRLAAHLGAAMVLYAGMLAGALAVKADWRYARSGAWSRLADGRTVDEVLRNPLVRRFRRQALAVAALVLLTAFSGAFVAGLDAGLIYNEFPLMGGRLAPPAAELFSPAYATSTAPDGSSTGLWRNLFENPTTVQFDHRVLATTTYVATGALWAAARRTPLPPLAARFAGLAFAMANVQAALGISTLLYLVPVSLAAMHQAGAIALLTVVLHIPLALRRPGAAARAWRQAYLARKAKP
ncbi:cytochrome oxidase assembly protein-domain-containing protein [Gloeopeniophorella convolvens]|nr:cytochrome oxidase assembly protein-domain-containing protein [Gloeopeniophorella convolvens]